MLISKIRMLTSARKLSLINPCEMLKKKKTISWGSNEFRYYISKYMISSIHEGEINKIQHCCQLRSPSRKTEMTRRNC